MGFCPGNDHEVLLMEVLGADPVNHLSNVREDILEYTQYARAIFLTEAQIHSRKNEWGKRHVEERRKVEMLYNCFL